jgi:hypothetical protein
VEHVPQPENRPRGRKASDRWSVKRSAISEELRTTLIELSRRAEEVKACELMPDLCREDARNEVYGFFDEAKRLRDAVLLRWRNVVIVIALPSGYLDYCAEALVMSNEHRARKIAELIGEFGDDFDPLILMEVLKCHVCKYSDCAPVSVHGDDQLSICLFALVEGKGEGVEQGR